MCTLPLYLYSELQSIFYQANKNKTQLLMAVPPLFCLVLMVNQLNHLHECHQKLFKCTQEAQEYDQEQKEQHA